MALGGRFVSQEAKEALLRERFLPCMDLLQNLDHAAVVEVAQQGKADGETE